MLVIPKPEIKKLDAPSPQRDGGRDDLEAGRQALQLVKILALVLVAIAVSAGAYRLFVRPSSRPETLPLAVEKVQPLIRAGQRITVPEGSPLRTRLAIQPVTERDFQRSLLLPAVVEADPGHLIKVLPPLAGRVTQLKVQLGERVQAGQPLVVIDAPDLATAYADYDRAKDLLGLALKNRDRQRILGKQGWTAEKDLQQVETDYATAQVELQRAGARLKKIGVDAEATNELREVTVVAPMAGSVIELTAAPGAYWNDTTAALMTVADLSTVWVSASVPEKDSALVSKGQFVEVNFPAYPGEVFKGHVLFVSDVLDPDTRRTKVRIEDANQVLVEVEPWTFEARTVDINFQQGDQAVLKSGLNAGDRVVVKGGVLLGD